MILVLEITYLIIPIVLIQVLNLLSLLCLD